VTNCSPQRGNFNQSGKGGIWGKLENFIGAQADKEKFSIFAGPVLSPKDQIFPGTQPVMLPKKFWKVICAVKDKKLQVFAFVLEQETKDLPLEFQVTAEWKSKQVKLKDLEKLLGIVKFPAKYHTADQA
jgi:endonuclease G